MKEQQTFYVVWRCGGDAPTKKHHDIGDAHIEAKRLAMENPCSEFIVLKAVSGHVTPPFNLIQVNYGNYKRDIGGAK